MLTRRARLKGCYKGRKFYEIPVVVVYNDSRGDLGAWTSPHTEEFTVVAPTASAAANWAADQVRERPETEVHAFGPKGGEVCRYIGWETAIGNRLFQGFPAQQNIL